MTLFFVFEVRCCSKKHISDKFLHYYLQELHFYARFGGKRTTKNGGKYRDVEISFQR